MRCSALLSSVTSGSMNVLRVKIVVTCPDWLGVAFWRALVVSPRSHRHALSQAFSPTIASLSIMTGNMTTMSRNQRAKPAIQSAVVPSLTLSGGWGSGLDSVGSDGGTGGSGFNCFGGSRSWSPRRWESEGLVVSAGELSGFGGTGGPL
jgi:hypothetical protein